VSQTQTVGRVNGKSWFRINENPDNPMSTEQELNMTIAANSTPTVAPHRATTNSILVLSVLASRTVLLILSYFITAWLFMSLDMPTPYDLARAWWPVALVLINGIVLVLLFFAVKREGITLASLIGFKKSMFRKDIVASLWMIPVSLLLAVGATMGLGAIFYNLQTPSGLMSLSTLPAWAMVITLAFHPLINAFVEEMTYNGYVFPRIDGLLRSPGLAVTLVTFFFALQHIGIPFAFDAKFLVWRFLSFVPLLLFWVLAYAKMRRLPALIIVHWFMDVFAVLTILFIPSS
jgi:membrane protease YdiL (CAAX protease family)